MISRTEKDRAVVLRLRPYLEFDVLVTIFTEKTGKRTILAKGLRRPRSKNSGIIQPFSVLLLEMTVPRTETSLPKLVQADLFSLPPKEMSLSLFFIVELSERMTREGQRLSSLFGLLIYIAKGTKQEIFPLIFFLKLLTTLGYLPEYGLCSRTHACLTSGGIWLSNGELVSLTLPEQGVALTFSEIKILRYWQKNYLPIAERVDVSVDTCEKFAEFLFTYLEQEQGIHLKTKKYLLGSLRRDV